MASDEKAKMKMPSKCAKCGKTGKGGGKCVHCGAAIIKLRGVAGKKRTIGEQWVTVKGKRVPLKIER